MKNIHERQSSLLGRNLPKEMTSLSSQRQQSLSYETNSEKLNPLKVKDFKAQQTKTEENA